LRGSADIEGAGTCLGRQDLHVHTTMSDGDLTLDEVVAVAAELGVAVGVADHVSGRNRRLFISTIERLESYLAALEAAPVFRSAELCWCDPFAARLPRRLLDRFDYIIGSNHGFALPDGTFASPWWNVLPPAWEGRADELMEVMVHNLCDMVRSMPIDVAAHSTMIPRALSDLEPDVLAWWTEDREDRFIESAVASGVAVEISNRYRVPHQRFLRKALQAGARFTLGSDGHHLEQVARLDWAEAAAREAGIGELHLFVARR